MVHNVITNIGKIYFIAYYCATHKNYITIYVFKARLEKLQKTQQNSRIFGKRSQFQGKLDKLLAPNAVRATDL